MGCDDGTVRLFDYHDRHSDNSSCRVDYMKTIPSVGCRVLSIAFHPSENKLFYGCADGTIRCVDDVSTNILH